MDREATSSAAPPPQAVATDVERVRRWEERIRALATDPERLEELYRQVQGGDEEPAFAAAVAALAADRPDNLLLAAWQARLRRADRVAGRAIAWRWAIPLALANGLALFAFSGDRWWVLLDQTREVPLALLVAGPLSACFVLLYVCLAGDRAWRRLALTGALVLATTAYGLWIQPKVAPRVLERQYLQLLVLHLPLLAWAAVGLYVLRELRDAEARFVFLSRSLEVAAIASLLAGMGGAFAGVTYFLFQAIDFELPEAVMRLLVAGGGGAIVVLAVALAYDPRLALFGQVGDEGLARILALAARLLLPLAVLVGLAYLPFVALHFRVPFENREVLVVYNVMLFAIATLLVAAVPPPEGALRQSWASWLRRGLLAAAGLALLVGLYALVAVAYRTALDGWTPNRLAVLGWNVILIAILVQLLAGQWRRGEADWADGARRSLSLGFFALGGWAMIVVLVLPWLFLQPPQGATDLPPQVRWLVENWLPPILLTCEDRPEVYLLERGRKRWIRDIPTFEQQGFRWNDVVHIPCTDLAVIADGPPIPPDAGRPPTPATAPTGQLVPTDSPQPPVPYPAPPATARSP